MDKIELQTEVDIKYFGERVTIEKNIECGNSTQRYVYKISHNGTSYILKGFKIRLDHLNIKEQKSVNKFKESMDQINEVYQEYSFTKAACAFNNHFVKPLFLDYEIKVAAAGDKYTYLHIEIIFEDGGISLDKMRDVSIDKVYNLMRQSANALLLLHDIGIAHFDIKPGNMVYKEKDDILKIIDMGSAFGSSTKNKIINSTIILDGKIRSATPHYAPPEVLRMIENPGKAPGIEVTIGSVDVYCWAMCFHSMIKKKSNSDLLNDNKTYKVGSEMSYKDYIEIVEEDLDSIETKNSAEKDKIDIIKKLLTNSLKYKPKDRPTMRMIVNEFENTHSLKISYIDAVSSVRTEIFDKSKKKEERKGLMPQSITRSVKHKHSSLERKKLREIPVHEDSDLVSPKVKEIEKKLGPFKYEEPLDESLEIENTVKLSDESLYTGQWNKTGHRHGRGICTYSKGYKYEGYWKNDLPYGKGRVIYNDGDVYEGDFVNDKAEGYGVYTHSHGGQYKGKWKNDKQHGIGIERWSNGYIYNGEYEDGKKCGRGYSRLADGSEYKGEFYKNDIHGKGIYTWPDGGKFDGEWKKNLMDGKGTYTWADGKKYVGAYVGGLRSGYGEFFWPDGRQYKGQWENGKQNGIGIYTTAEGVTEKGEWKDGKRVS